MRVKVSVSLVVALTFAAVHLLPPHACAGELRFPAQPLDMFLCSLGEQTKTNDPDSVRNIFAPAFDGSVGVQEALSRLLVGSGLTYSAHRQVLNNKASHTADSSANPASPKPEQKLESALDEVIVSAQKRGEERLQDVPMPVATVSAGELVNSNQLRLQEYYASIPSLNLTAGLRGNPLVAIRGLTNGDLVSPTVGMLVDDIPFQHSHGFSPFGSFVPDIDPNDLTRIEILRGPQGTLYGASSIGGVINFVMSDPSTDRVGGRLQAGTTSVAHGDGLGYNVRGIMNLPLGSALGVRLSGYSRSEPGYIDNHFFGDPANGIKEDVNDTRGRGGRVSALWKPSEQFSLKLSALLQNMRTEGLPSARPDLGELQQNLLRGTGVVDDDTRAYSAVLKAELGSVDITSLTGYFESHSESTYDLTPGLGFLAQILQGVPAISSFALTDADKFAQEVRLSGPVGERLEWLVGGFYTDESMIVNGFHSAIDPATGASPGFFLLEYNRPIKYEEYAAFVNLAIQITSRFDIQLGGRHGFNRQVLAYRLGGALLGDPTATVFPVTLMSTSKDDSFTYLLTPRFKWSPNLMIYARFASGYRPGGPQRALSPGFPIEYEPDTTLNYEFGVKGNALDKAFSFDASLYYIDWTDIQTTINESGFGYTANPGNAKSQGVEFSVESQPVPGLTIAGWVTWNEAELTEAFPLGAVVGRSGDRLPFSSRFSGSVSLDQEFPLTSSITGFVGVSVTYVGERYGNFVGSGTNRDRLPSYTKVDLSAGVGYDLWTINIFANNVSDKLGVIGLGGFGGDFPYFQYIQPRTIGLSVARTF